MSPDHLRELENRAALCDSVDVVKKLEAKSRVHGELEAMKAEGKAIELSDEEVKLLQSFRRFRLRMRKTSEMFTWQTRKPEGVVLVEETALIVSPEESALCG